MATENYIFGKPGPEISGAQVFGHFINYCRKNRYNSAWLFTPGLRNVTAGSIPVAVGAAAAKRLAKGDTILIQGVDFTLKSGKKMSVGSGRPLLAFWPTETQLHELDELEGLPALFVVPWVLEHTKTWALARRPTDILAVAGAQTEPIRRSIVANPVVEEALKMICGSINVSTGVSNQDDKKTVIDTFKILRNAGESYTTSEVQAWLIQNGMPAKSAAEVSKIADDPSKFRANRANPFSYLPKNALEIWRGKAP